MTEVVLDKYLNGKSCDISFKTKAGVIAYEVQLENSVRNDLCRDMILKDLRSGFIEVVIVVQSKKSLEKVVAVIAELDANQLILGLGGIKEKVQVKLLAEFLERSKEV